VSGLQRHASAENGASIAEPIDGGLQIGLALLRDRH
jgi:hypothetical protein